MKESIPNPNIFSTFADFSERLLTSDTPGKIVDETIRFISEHMGASSISVALFESPDFSLILERRAGLASAQKASPHLERTRDVADGIRRGGEILALSDEQSKEFLIYFDAAPQPCELRLPFIYEPSGIGVVSLGKKESGTDYTLQDIDWLRLLVNILSLKCRALMGGDRTPSVSEGRHARPQRIWRPSHFGSRLKVLHHEKRSDFLGDSPAMQKIRALIDRVARENIPVLITGESGTGKELVARAIHAKSPRCDHPLVAMNCAALADTLVESELFGHEKGAFTGAFSRKKGKFEFANNSTLFLDEIADTSLPTQAKLLRVLQDGTFQRVGGNETLYSNARLVCATNKNLRQLMREGLFREDLYYRINVMPIDLPPLRERGEDVIQLADYFFRLYNEYYQKELEGIDSDVYAWMRRYPFPGNIRELKNMIERAVIMAQGRRLTLDLFSTFEESQPWTSPRSPFDPNASLEEIEREHIRAVLEQVQYNKSAAARRLGIARKTLREKIQKYRLFG